MLWYFHMNLIAGSKGTALETQKFTTARDNPEYRNFYKKDHKAKTSYEKSTFFLLFKYIFLYSPKDWIPRGRQKPVLNIWSQTVFTPWKKLSPQK